MRVRALKALCVLICYVALMGIIFNLKSGSAGTGRLSIKEWYKSFMGINFNVKLGSTETGNFSVTKLAKNVPNITIMVRTSFKQGLGKMLYCSFLRTVVLFWPHSYGDVVLVLDEESANDKHLGDTLLKQIYCHFPEYSFRVFYEALPKDPRILKNKFRGVGYIRQLWSTFFSDLYSSENIIAYMDTDTLMLTPITTQHLLKGTKLKMFGRFEKHHGGNYTVRTALGFPIVADFMCTGFPQMMYRDTYMNCRQHIMKHLNTTDFEEAFKKFFHSNLQPVAILMSYAWYFEKHRYDWHLSVPSLNIINSGLPEGHKVQPEDTLLSLVPIWHAKNWPVDRIKPGYCLSMKAQGQMLPGCKNVTHNLSQICDLGIGHRWRGHGAACKGLGYEKCCQQIVNKHYEHVRHMARSGIHTVQKKKAELVSTLAKEMGIQCEPLGMP